MVYLKKPNSLMKISPIPIGAIYFRMKISNLYICIFKVPLLLTSSHTIFFIQVPSGEDRDKEPA